MTSIDRKEQITKEITQLVKEGQAMLTNHLTKDPQKRKRLNVFEYEGWYTRCLPLMRTMLPDRFEHFKAQYHQDKRKTINANTYTISDYLGGVGLPTYVDDHDSIVSHRMLQQIAILGSAAHRIDSVLEDITSYLRSEVLDDELKAAKKLLKANHIRAAGAVAGVILEKHLSIVCSTHGVALNKKDPTINDYASRLKSDGLVDLQVFKHLEYLGGLRNLCCHHKGKEPKTTDAEDLIAGVEKITKTLS